MHTSIVIPTHNRAESLKRTLRSVLRQEFPKNRLEVIVVDNGSSDHTKQVTESFMPGARYPVRYVSEPRVGLSHARNRGVDEAQGEIVVFIDDDALPRNGDWIQHLVQAYMDPQVSAAGGDLEAVWPSGKRPAWLHDFLITPLGLTRFEFSKTTELHYPDYPWGANISYRRQCVQRQEGFFPGLGRRADQLLSGEETELCLRLEKEGKKIVYVADAIVDHTITAEQLTNAWFKKRASCQGATDAITEILHFSMWQRTLSLTRRSANLFIHSCGIVLFSLVRSPKWRLFCQYNAIVSWSYVLRAIGTR